MAVCTCSRRALHATLSSAEVSLVSCTPMAALQTHGFLSTQAQQFLRLSWATSCGRICSGLWQRWEAIDARQPFRLIGPLYLLDTGAAGNLTPGLLHLNNEQFLSRHSSTLRQDAQNIAKASRDNRQTRLATSGRDSQETVHLITSNQANPS
jgi:hypothetical protein